MRGPTDWSLTEWSLACQAVGLLLTGIGLFQTWQAFSPKDERFFTPVARWLKRAASAVGRLIRRLRAFLGFPPRRPPVSTTLDTPFNMGVGQVLAEIQYGLSAELPTSEAVAELDRRLRQTSERLSLLDRVLGNRVDTFADQQDKTNQAVMERLDILQRTNDKVALDGVRLEVMGLVVVAVGLALQVAAALAT
jgi:hypothetical protein